MKEEMKFKWSCWFKHHLWVCISVFHYVDVSYGSKGSPSTAAVFSCQHCGVTKDKTFFGMGHINPEHFNREKVLIQD